MKRAYVSALAMALATAASIAVPAPAMAWGKFGHLTICELAYRNLTDASQAAVGEILQSRQGGIFVPGRGQADDRTYTAFNYGCLEEDELPRRHPEDHFVNVARSEKQIPATCPGGGNCLFSGITRDFDTLKDRTKPREARAFALMALGHWIGDIHQPLHISFSDDRGGNSIDVQLMGRCGTSPESRPDNLHAVWDKCLLDAGMFERVRKRADFNREWSRFTIIFRAVDTLQANRKLADVKDWVASTPQEWAAESYRVTLDPETLYCTVVGPNCQYSPTSLASAQPKRRQQIDQAYLADHEDIAAKRVTQAGFRLAHMLNLALDPAYRGPT